ncbi:hypothetical protein [Enterovibrio norvegicus]|uniref:hypothetical protein n=1 Tax=Enterovibrio norvegicus TaxID=188144 RepID=UPI000C8281ED|nr:hypothetical protein [Enterovibrio norvegicus]PML76087.1 hypothetical protein BCT69_05420 [Enterovibrio norvegicus]
MTDLDEQLHLAFDKWADQGPESLSDSEWPLFRAQNFILQWEAGGLSGYLYNSLPDHAEIRATLDSLLVLGLTVEFECLSSAYKFFENYTDPEQPSTWAHQCSIYDSEESLDDLDQVLQRAGG